MKTNTSRSDPERRGTRSDFEKLPYEPPSIIWEESFDKDAALAAACGKTYVSQGGPCATAPGGS